MTNLQILLTIVVLIPTCIIAWRLLTRKKRLAKREAEELARVEKLKKGSAKAFRALTDTIESITREYNSSDSGLIKTKVILDQIIREINGKLYLNKDGSVSVSCKIFCREFLNVGSYFMTYDQSFNEKEMVHLVVEYTPDKKPSKLVISNFTSEHNAHSSYQKTYTITDKPGGSLDNNPTDMLCNYVADKIRYNARLASK